jgi:hypothetical protein
MKIKNFDSHIKLNLLTNGLVFPSLPIMREGEFIFPITVFIGYLLVIKKVEK